MPTPGVFHHERSKSRAHDHVVFHLDGAGRPPARVVFNDPRRFGFMLLGRGRAADHPMLRGLGTEPTGNALDGALLRNLLARQAQDAAEGSLLDQTKIAGLGNIYVCEALWRARPVAAAAGRHHRRSAASGRKSAAMRSPSPSGRSLPTPSPPVARRLRDYVHADGSLGYFQHSFSRL